MHCWAFSRVMPPSAQTGIGGCAASARWQIPRNCSSPSRFADPLFSNTGPNTAKFAPCASAPATSAPECAETPITGSPLPARATIDRTSLADKSPAGKCTPCAPQASATSVRELMSSCVREPPSAAIAFIANSSSARLSKSFSRSCMYSTPAAAHSAIFANSRCSCLWRSPANCCRSVM